MVGAGIVGASIAWHLAQKGAAVTVIDRGAPGGGVTAASFAWIGGGVTAESFARINVEHGQPEPNHALRRLAIADWRRLEGELGGRLSIDWTGALTWSADAAATERLVRDHPGLQLAERAELARREPALLHPPACAAFAPEEGAVDAAAATAALLQAAAVPVVHGEVLAVATSGGRITGLRLPGEQVEADVVVLAAGTAAVPLALGLGVLLPVDASPAVLLRFATAARLPRHILSGPRFEVRQPTATTLLAAEDYPDDGDVGRVAAAAVRTLQGAFRGGEALSLVETRVGRRPIPADDLPIVGAVPSIAGLYVAVMHAGVNLAPAVGRLAADEILKGTSAPALAHCRPERFGAA